ncbi:PilZ domain-containing protein [Afifella sp. IM 167]|uniref:PilZ domain-containing protein n=1 Tax=Afifella sp. IM 167 TaxID=2033586 RepID=UPI001CCDBD65|nr:PilZ domain-containing protein [Afifella sp. IM 167]MBZ8134629.1 pilus assembly protein PilZ [Afifella sp. IM 167]
MSAAMPAERPEIDDASNRREHERVEVSLLGRCMLADTREHPCELRNISAGGAAIISPVKGEVGERIIIYADEIGRIEGVITRHTADGFAITITASARKREKLANTLTWLNRRNLQHLNEGRRAPRHVPLKSDARVVLPDGSEADCKIIDMSKTGAALAMTTRPPIGSRITLGKLGGRVVRHFNDGIAIEFMRIMSQEEIERILEQDYFPELSEGDKARGSDQGRGDPLA